MTQFFTSSSNGSIPSTKEEKRAFSGLPLSANRQLSNNQVSQKIKNFFRINSGDSKDGKGNASPDGKRTASQPHKTESGMQRSFRQSRFFIGRIRSPTVASEGHGLEESTVSPTAHANPYFLYQGPPGLRHHNEGSVPPSPPDSPGPGSSSKTKGDGQATNAGKEELARKLRRVASAPNAQGLFAKGKGEDDRPLTAELGKQPLAQHASALSLVDAVEGSMVPVMPGEGGGTLPTPGQIRNAVAFRRTYSSNSIKVRSVEVGPGSFDKIKLIGKGDVGKVYLVREKKSGRLYAMKGICLCLYGTG
jgi:protein-serine/threonine kinase